MKYFILLLMAGFLFFWSCVPKKSFSLGDGEGIVPAPMLPLIGDTIGIFTLRLKKEKIDINGVEIYAYKPTFEKNEIKEWNHLTYFIFSDDEKVEYHSLSPKNSRSLPDNNENSPEFSGWYRMDSTTLHSHPKKMIMELYRKKKLKPKYRERNPDIICEFMVDTIKNVLNLKVIKSSKVPFNRVYDIDAIFKKDATFIYCLEKYKNPK